MDGCRKSALREINPNPRAGSELGHSPLGTSHEEPPPSPPFAPNGPPEVSWTDRNRTEEEAVWCFSVAEWQATRALNSLPDTQGI